MFFVQYNFPHLISIHVLREEDDRRLYILVIRDVAISIHVLREEDDILCENS